MENTTVILHRTKFNPEDLDLRGRHLYHSNTTMKEIANIMEHPEFKEFFGKYFNDWNSVKTMIMLMKIYEQLDINFKDLNGYQKLAMVYDTIGDSTIRPTIVSKLLGWIDEKRK